MFPNMKVAILCLLFCTSIHALPFNTRYTEGLANIGIQQTLSRYALAIDQKNFGSLSKVFTSDAIGRYGSPPPNDVVYGLDAIQDLLSSMVGQNETQHTISTTVVDFDDKRSPNYTAYLVANYFGQWNLTGQLLSFYGQYFDTWVYQDGYWKTKDRKLVLFVSHCMSEVVVHTLIDRIAARDYRQPSDTWAHL